MQQCLPRDPPRLALDYLDERETLLQKSLSKLREAVTTRTNSVATFTPVDKFVFFEKIRYVPHPGQLPIHLSAKKYRVVGGGRRGGKTYSAAREAVAYAYCIPNAVVWIVGPTYQLASRCFKYCWNIVYRDLKTPRISGSTYGDLRINFPNGSVIEAKSGDSPDNLVGEGLDFVIIDEGQKLQRFIWDECILPALSQKDGGALWIGSWENETDFMADLWLDPPDMVDWDVFSFETWTNTYEFPGGYDDPKLQRMRRQLDPLEFLRQFGARMRRNPYVVFKEFDRTIHVDAWEFHPDLPVYLGIDVGTSNPYAVCAVQKVEDILHVFDEYYDVAVLTEDVYADLSKRVWWPNVIKGVCDDAANADIMRWNNLLRQSAKLAGSKEQQFRVVPATKGTAGEEASIQFYRKFLRDPIIWNGMVREKFRVRTGRSEPDLRNPQDFEITHLIEHDLTKEEMKRAAKIFFDQHCRMTIKEHNSYHYAKPHKTDLNMREKPRDASDHTCDALRYLVWSTFRHGSRIPPRRY